MPGRPAIHRRIIPIRNIGPRWMYTSEAKPATQWASCNNNITTVQFLQTMPTFTGSAGGGIFSILGFANALNPASLGIGAMYGLADLAHSLLPGMFKPQGAQMVNFNKPCGKPQENF